MYMYYILILLWGVIYAQSLKIKITQQKIFAAVLFGLTLFLVMGLRDKSVGSDIWRYFDLYNSQNFYAYGSYNKFEYGFDAYMGLLSYLGFSDHMFLMLTSLFITVSFTRFFYKYSKNVGLSFYLHLTIGLFVITMSALRQSMAICFILFAIDFILERKFLLFLITVYIATTFHFSAICFFPVYFLFNVKLVSYKRIIYLLILMIFLLFFHEILLRAVQKIIPQQYLSLYGIFKVRVKMNILLVVIAFAIPVFIVLMWKLTNENIKLISAQDSFFFILTCISTVITIFALNSIIISRISYYFIPAYIVLIPNVMSRLSIHFNKLLIYGALIFICFVYFVLGTVGGILEIDNYRFFFF